MRLVKIAFALTLLAVGAAVAVLFTLPGTRVKPTAAVAVEIPRGTGTRGIADLLAAKGVVASPWHFLTARLTRSGARLQAGLYDFSEEASAAEVLDRIVRGDVHFDSITIPEGKNIWDVSELAGKLGWFTADEFLRATQDPALIAQVIPEIKPAPASLEGYLFPSTYKVVPNATPRQIIKQMVGEFHKVWNSLDATLPVQEAVILASLVETEARRPDEPQDARRAPRQAVAREDEAHVLVRPLVVFVADDDGDPARVHRSRWDGRPQFAFVHRFKRVEDAVAAFEFWLAQQLPHPFDDRRRRLYLLLLQEHVRDRRHDH